MRPVPKEGTTTTILARESLLNFFWEKRSWHIEQLRRATTDRDKRPPGQRDESRNEEDKQRESGGQSGRGPQGGRGGGGPKEEVQLRCCYFESLTSGKSREGGEEGKLSLPVRAAFFEKAELVWSDAQ